MALERFVHRLESRMAQLGKLLCPADPREQLLEEIEELSRELQTHQAALIRSQKDCDETRQRLADNEALVAMLPSRVEVAMRRGENARAFQHALQLDEVRKILDHDRTRLPQLEQTVWSLQFLVRQLTRRLARLQEQLHPR